MKPLIVLLLTTSISYLALRFFKHKIDIKLSARIGLSVMLIFTGIGHFIFTHGMSKMIPGFIPFKGEIIYLTALLEFLAAFGIHIQRLRRIASILLIIFFIVLLPANINAAIEGLNYQTGTVDGPGIDYLWFRVPLQVVFVLWTYWSALKKKEN